MWRVFHHEVGLLAIGQQAEVVDGQDIGMLHIRDLAHLLKEVSLCFGVEFIKAQDLEGEHAIEWIGLTDLIDMAVTAGADEGEQLVDVDTRSRHEKIAKAAVDGAIRIIVTLAEMWIEAARHVFYLPSLLLE